MQEGKIICIGKDAVSRIFYYTYTVTELTNIEHTLNIFASQDYSDPDFFYLKAQIKDDEHLQIVSILKNDDSLYGAKGIPDSAIPKLKVLSGKSICSSPSASELDPNEYRTLDATKMWERLRINGMATYDQNSDIYTHA